MLAIVLSSSGGGTSSAPAKKLAGGSGAVPHAAQSAALLANIPQSGITLGSPHAPATLVEFADLQCPFCREYTANVLPALIQKYVRTGKLEMQFRNLSFIGPDSQTAGHWAAAAGAQDKLWQFLDLWYANQQTENSGYVTDSYLRRIAGGVGGLNVAMAAAASGAPAAQAQLTAADQLAAHAGIDSTPSFLLGKSGGRLRTLNYSDLTPAAFTPAIDALTRG